jgi:aldose 1-epimerase
MSLRAEIFGRDDGGRPVPIYSLSSANGLEARVTSYGATLVSLKVPDRQGIPGDIVLGFDDLAGYLGEHPYFGCIVGRFANRIAGGLFVLEGVEYRLACNDRGNHLHGGTVGFGRRTWTVESSAVEPGGGSRLTLAYVSPDGEEGYPGRLEARVTYWVDGNQMEIEYEATCDAPTLVNLTSHAYFNLGGSGTTLGHELRIDAERFVPVDELLIPTGELRAVGATPMDFRTLRVLGQRQDSSDPQIARAGGYDHTWVLSPLEGCRPAAELYEPVSGRRMEVSTTQPGLQFYGGQLLDGSLRGKNGCRYGPNAGLCLETQHFPDSPHHAAFPSAVLGRGQTYRERSLYRFSTD